LVTAPKKTLSKIPVPWPDLLASHDQQGSGEDYPIPSALGLWVANTASTGYHFTIGTE
jgi:hypothetical protein